MSRITPFLLIILGFLWLHDGLAQDVQVGYLKVDHTIYAAPEGAEITKLPRGEHIKAVALGPTSHWFQIFVLGDDGEKAVGYTLNPWLSENPPPRIRTELTGESASDEQPPEARPATPTSPEPAPSRGPFYLHTFSNVRSAPSVSSDIVAQLPPGTEVEVARMEGNWALIYRPHDHDGGTIEHGEPLGYISRSLLHNEPADDAQTIMVYVTRSGRKYHRKDCRYVRHARFSLTLAEAMEQGFEPCRVCKPPQQ